MRPLADAERGQVEAAGCAIKSATEPFGTGSPFGRAMFQFLGVMAELERSNIETRTTDGRTRASREGRHTGGSVPLGYDVDATGALIPSEWQTPGTALSEAVFVRDLYRRVAEGSTLRAECLRLNAVGVPTGRRLGRGKLARPKKNAWPSWSTSTLSCMVRNPIYMGAGVFRPRRGGESVPRPAPALVDAALRERARARLRANLRMGPGDAGYVVLLRGLVRCAHCGRGYVAAWSSAGRKRAYRCSSQFEPKGRIPCSARLVQAEWLESRLWSRVAEFCRTPGPYLAAAQAEVRGRLSQAEAASDDEQRLQDGLRDKGTERERVLTLYRRGRVTLDAAEQEIDAIAREEAALREQLALLEGRQRLALASETQLTEVAASLHGLREQIDDIEETGDREKMRALIELLVREVEITTTGEGRRKRVQVEATLAFDQRLECAGPVESSSRMAKRTSFGRRRLRAGQSYPIQKSEGAGSSAPS